MAGRPMFSIMPAIFLGLGLLALAGSAAHAVPPSLMKNLRPTWSHQPVGEWAPNISMLWATDSYDEASLTDNLLDAASIGRIRHEYEALERSYEDRKHAGLVDPTGQGAQFNRMSDFTKMVSGELRDVQTKKMVATLQSAAAKSETVKKPLAIAVGIAAATTGTPLNASIGSDTTLQAAANLPFQVSYLQIFSPLGNGAVTLVGAPDAGAGNKMTLPPPDWIARDEHYVFAFSRPLPFWGLGSGLSYLGSSSAMSASISKTLSPNFVASLTSVRPMDVESRYKAPEETLRLSYELRF